MQHYLQCLMFLELFAILRLSRGWRSFGGLSW